jgi:hypothetical protein
MGSEARVEILAGVFYVYVGWAKDIRLPQRRPELQAWLLDTFERMESRNQEIYRKGSNRRNLVHFTQPNKSGKYRIARRVLHIATNSVYVFEERRGE